MVEGPEGGLELLAPIADQLDDYHLFHAVRGDLLARCARDQESATAFRRAAARTANLAEQHFLERRASVLERG